MTNDKATTESQNQLIPISKLEKSPLNARRTVAKAADEELKASILAHGLMQNLVVTAGKKGKFHVIAGARRLEAIKALQAEGRLPADFAAPCQVVSDDRAAEMSLAENVVRQAMHPADEFEAFAALIDRGQTAAQVAQRFGVSERLVVQRMKLAKVAPGLIGEYRAGKMPLAALEAFTITDDHERQVAVYESLTDWQLKRPGEIRDLLTGEAVKSDDRLVKFVGLDTYERAGGTTRTDLFGDDVFLENPELLQALVSEKLKLAEKELAAEGWGWVLVEMERDWQSTQGCSRIQPEPVDAPKELLDRQAAIEAEFEAAETAYYDDDGEDEAVAEAVQKQKNEAEARLEAINEELEAFARFDPARMKAAGCYAYVSSGGKLEVERGLVRRQDAKKAAQDAGGATEGAEPAPNPKGMPESLKRDLEAYRLQVAQAEIAMNPGIAFDLLVFHVACDILDSRASTGLDVHFRKSYRMPSVESDTLAARRLEAVEKGLPVAWMDEDNEAGRFHAFRQLQDGDKHQLLAYCTALTLKPGLAIEGCEPEADEFAMSLTGADVAEYWRPTAANYLSRITKEQLLAIGDETFGGHFLARWGKAKKGELVALLDKAFANPEADNRANVVARLKSWLPQGMAFPRAEPVAGKPKVKKGKKAA